MVDEPAATKSPHAPAPKKQVQALLFWCGKDAYALPVIDVYKVVDLELAAVNALPRVHQKVLGITQYRGRIITVLDARELLYGKKAEPNVLKNKMLTPVSNGPQTRILVLDRAKRSIGIWVQSVGEITQLLAPAESSGKLLIPSTYRGEIVQLIDTERLLLLATDADDIGENPRTEKNSNRRTLSQNFKISSVKDMTLPVKDLTKA